MKHCEGLPDMGIETINPRASRRLLRPRARQVSNFMAGVQRFYRDDLGLRRIDSDPMPNPRIHNETNWRIRRFRASGPVEEAGLQFLLAIKRDSDGSLSKRLEDVAGLLVLRKLVDSTGAPRLCNEGTHQPTEILEWDVAKPYRGNGLGRILLQHGMAAVHPEDTVTLYVAQPNQTARRIYEHYGFEPGAGEPERHGVFDVEHLPMEIPAAQLRQNLHIPAA